MIIKQKDNDRILNQLALISQQLNSPISLEYADLAHKVKPDKAQNLDTLGWVLLKNNNPARAVQFLKAAAEKALGNPDIRYHYAVALNKTGQLKEAKKQLCLLINMEGRLDNRLDAKKLLGKLK